MNPEPSQERAPRANARSGTSSRVVLWAWFLLFVSFIGGLWFAYWKLIAYERRAALHLPPGTEFALRVDLEQVVLFEPVRRHLFPVLTEQLLPSSGLAEWEQKTGIDLGMDLREIVFARPDSGWLVAVGGLFPKTGVVAALHQVIVERKLAECTYDRERMQCPQAGWFAQQAADGVMLFASDPVVLDRALPESRQHEHLGLGKDTAAGFGLDLGWVKRRISALPFGVLSAGLLEQVARVEGEVELGSDLRLEVRLVPGEGADLTPLANTLRATLEAAAGWLALIGHSDQAGERGLLASAEINPQPGGQLAVQSTWSRQELDRAAQSAARALSSWAETRGFPKKSR